MELGWYIVQMGSGCTSPVEDSLQKGVLRGDKTSTRHLSYFPSSPCWIFFSHKTNMLSMSLENMSATDRQFHDNVRYRTGWDCCHLLLLLLPGRRHSHNSGQPPRDISGILFQPMIGRECPPPYISSHPGVICSGQNSLLARYLHCTRFPLKDSVSKAQTNMWKAFVVNMTQKVPCTELGAGHISSKITT